LPTIDPSCAGQLPRRYREPKFSRRLFIGGAAVNNRAAVTIGACFDFRKGHAKLDTTKNRHGASELTSVKAVAPQRPHAPKYDA
jgi:hypothetical protein